MTAKSGISSAGRQLLRASSPLTTANWATTSLGGGPPVSLVLSLVAGIRLLRSRGLQHRPYSTTDARIIPRPRPYCVPRLLERDAHGQAAVIIEWLTLTCRIWVAQPPRYRQSRSSMAPTVVTTVRTGLLISTVPLRCRSHLRLSTSHPPAPRL